jgi:hypothetical protein
LANDTQHAVTAMQLGNFCPDGCLIVAFDDGKIRTWQSCVNTEKNEKNRKRNQPGKEISELGNILFNMID